MAKHTGGCQCGAVRYEAEADLEGLIACNCSRCGRLGLVLKFVPEAAFTLLSGEGAQTQYLFNTHKIHHRFCSTCGVESFAHGTGPDGSKMVALNVRTFDDVNVHDLKPTPHDGRAK